MPVTVSSGVVLASSNGQLTFNNVWQFDWVKISSTQIELNVTSYPVSELNFSLTNRTVDANPKIVVYTNETVYDVSNVKNWTYSATFKNVTLFGLSSTQTVEVSWTGAYSRTAQETLAASASINTGAGRYPSESSSVSASTLQGSGKFPSESTDVVGTVREGHGKYPSESLELILSILKGSTIYPSESLALISSILKGQSVFPSESLTLIVSTLQGSGRFVSDTLQATSTVVKGQYMILSDLLSMLESLSGVKSVPTQPSEGGWIERVVIPKPEGMQLMIGALKISPVYWLPLPQVQVAADITYATEVKPTATEATIWATDSQNNTMYKSVASFEDVPAGGTRTYTIAFPLFKADDYILHMIIMREGKAVGGEARQYFTVTHQDLWFFHSRRTLEV